jgi:hypothetical protein
MAIMESVSLYRVKSPQTRDTRRKGSDNSSKGRGIPGKDLKRVLDWKRMNSKVERCKNRRRVRKREISLLY